MKAQIEVRVIVVYTMEVDNVSKSVRELTLQAQERVHSCLHHMIKEYGADDCIRLLSPESSVKVAGE